MENISPKERARIVKTYYEEGSSNVRTRRRVFTELNIQVTEMQVKRMVTHCEDKNIFDPKLLKARRRISGRPKREDHEAILGEILVSILGDPRLSIRIRAAQLELPKSTVHRGIKKLGMKAYRVIRVQALKKEYYPRRLEFCE
jgi:hypothetical protein